MIYNEADVKYVMEQKEVLKEKEQFPSFVPSDVESYTQMFSMIDKFLNDTIHPNVVLGASSSGDGVLNDHGASHIAMVMDRARIILRKKAEELRGYEIFILLLAIHFHDVGNIMGRDKHEERIAGIFERIGDSIPLDNASRRIISEIAMAHGGKIDGDKDTIFYLQEIDYICGIQIRVPVLASILRFADEIADDFRISGVVVTKKTNMSDHSCWL